MKGIVFTEFLDMVEDAFSIDTAERIIRSSNPASGGAYTAVGTYDYRELVQLVVGLSEISATPVPALIHAFGKHLFRRFVVLFPDLFAGVENAFDFLSQVEDHIHVEVRKLYPDAELPHFEIRRPAEDRLEMLYRSQRPFPDLAEGLIAACLEHFGEDIRLAREPLPTDERNCVRFILTCPAEVASCST